jgi:hypothetical protein
MKNLSEKSWPKYNFVKLTLGVDCIKSMRGLSNLPTQLENAIQSKKFAHN